MTKLILLKLIRFGKENKMKKKSKYYNKIKI